MEEESDTLLAAAVADSLKVSGPGGQSNELNTKEQEEDHFYDCDDTFHAEKTGQPVLNRTEVSHSKKPDQGSLEGQHNKLPKESSENLVNTENVSVDKGLCEESAATRAQDVPEDNKVLGDDTCERNDEEEKRTDSDSEFKEAEETPEFDDEYLREAEKNLTEEEKECRRAESMALKEKGNAQFKNQEYAEAWKSYTDALGVCPVCYSKERSILFSNRAAARMHLDEKQDAINDCTKAIELNPEYVRAILRRAELYEKTDKLDEALEDYKSVLEKEPGHPTAREACFRLPQQIQERNEKLKEEMLGKLKDLGNMILRPFGLSTANFQVKQDDNTGSYSVNFVQNPNNNR